MLKLIAFVSLTLFICIGGLFDASAQDLMDMSKRCEKAQSQGMAYFRDCQWQAWERIAERIQGKECTRTKCYLKLLRASRVSRTIEGSQTYLMSYKGSGFMFIEIGQDFKTGNEEVPYDGALLIDSEGRLSIIGRCIGNGCTVRSFARGSIVMWRFTAPLVPRMTRG